MSQEHEELRQWALTRAPGHYRRTCPYCSHTRKNSKLECLSTQVDHEKIMYRCWHCEEQGAVRLEPVKPKPVTYMDQRKQVHSNKAIKFIGQALDTLSINWLKSRGISEDTGKLYGAVAADAYFPTLQRETHAIAIPYYDNDKVIGHKLRSTVEKANVCQPALYTLCGLQNVDLEEEDHILICEGEPDMLSFAEAGVLNPTSVPNGASSFARNHASDEKANYGFLWPAKDLINKAKRVIIATDDDEPGEKLANELARRIGKHKCYRIFYPEGCKDANDVLLKKGKEALAECFDEAEPWPVAGLYEAARYFDEVDDLFINGYGDNVLTGLTPVDELYSLNRGLLTVITGVPGHGKSTFVDQLMINSARMNGSKFAICSFEKPAPEHIGQLSEMMTQKHFFDYDFGGQKMSKEELDGAKQFIHEHFKFLQQEDGAKSTIESVLERIKTAVFRWGIVGVVIDPFNYIAQPKNAESKTDWIDDILTQIRLCAQAYDLHIWFVAHPTKLPMDSNGNYSPPKGYSISGSAAWYSKPDFGLTIHKDPNEPGVVHIHNWKTRYAWMGKEGECTLLWDRMNHTYIASAMNDLPPMDFNYAQKDEYHGTHGHGDTGNIIPLESGSKTNPWNTRL